MNSTKTHLKTVTRTEYGTSLVSVDNLTRENISDTKEFFRFQPSLADAIVFYASVCKQYKYYA